MRTLIQLGKALPAKVGEPLKKLLRAGLLPVGMSLFLAFPVCAQEYGNENRPGPDGYNGGPANDSGPRPVYATGTDSTLIQSQVERHVNPLHILFLVDGSRSMIEDLERGTQKIDAAKQVVQNALSRIPSDVNLGLRVFGVGYGRRSLLAMSGLSLESECQNTALLVPIGRGNRRTILEQVRQIKPFGMTPLAYAIEQAAANDFRGLEGDKVIILITDGADTCGRNPCEVVERLPLFGIKLAVDVVGLGLKRDPAARRELNCISKTSGGKYYDAKTAAELVDSVSQSVRKAIQGRVIVKPAAPQNPGNNP